MIASYVISYTETGAISIDGGHRGYFDADGGTWEEEVKALLARDGFTVCTDWDTDDEDGTSSALAIRTDEARQVVSYTLAYQDAPGSTRSSEYDSREELAEHLRILATSDNQYTRDHLPAALVQCYVEANTPSGPADLLARACTVAEWQQDSGK